MYSPSTAKRLLDEKEMRYSDLAGYIFGDRSHSVKHLFLEGANPTAKIIEGLAEFLHVPIDYLFDRQVESAETAQDEGLLRKLVISQEDTIRLLKAENEALKEQVKLLQSKSATK